jgi:hypothetical protein
MRLIRSAGRVALRVLKFAMYIVWGLAFLCILYYAMISLYVSYVEIPGLDRFLGDASAVSARGDEVTAETERDGTAGFRAKTVIKFKPAHHWFATTLLVARSNNYLVGFKWRDDDRLVLILDFGCDAHMTDPVRSVGPVQILYRLDRTVIVPDHGYSSFPRDVPRKPCS